MNKLYKIKVSDIDTIYNRPTKKLEDLESIVNKVFNDIKTKGDTAIAKYTKQFDKVELNSFCVSASEISKANNAVSDELKTSINLAKNNIEKFHKSQRIEKRIIETTQGVECWQESRGIEKVGIYIPGGTAPLFSTVLMLAIPAKIAGCNQIILCTPPNSAGEIDPAILYTANLIGVEKIYKVGGIQAIAAMTYGTETIPNVYKIFGPGNQFVTVAKQIAQNKGIAIDMPAGPSELMLVADNSSNAEFVAADLLSQAEHGVDSQVVCLVDNEKLFIDIETELNKQLAKLPRKEIALQTLANSKFVCIEDKQKTIDVINKYAPEHLILSTNYNEFYMSNVMNAGSVFIGNYTPESAGDYASGTNHTLPTDGFAKAYSGVNLDSFVKKITFQKITKQGLQNIGNAIEIMADAEQLMAHKNAVTVRLNKINNKK